LLALAAASLGFGSHAEHSTAMEKSRKCSVGNHDLVRLSTACRHRAVAPDRGV
jgi:hypothetical protein